MIGPPAAVAGRCRWVLQVHLSSLCCLYCCRCDCYHCCGLSSFVVASCNDRSCNASGYKHQEQKGNGTNDCPLSPVPITSIILGSGSFLKAVSEERECLVVGVDGRRGWQRNNGEEQRRGIRSYSAQTVFSRKQPPFAAAVAGECCTSSVVIETAARSCYY